MQMIFASSLGKIVNAGPAEYTAFQNSILAILASHPWKHEIEKVIVQLQSGDDGGVTIELCEVGETPREIWLRLNRTAIHSEDEAADPELCRRLLNVTNAADQAGVFFLSTTYMPTSIEFNDATGHDAMSLAAEAELWSKPAAER
jgi:hypothetical protein